MPSPFPGMDPYLESPDLWPDVHHELISQIRAALNPSLRPAYVARVELRVYVSQDDDPGREVLVPDLRVEKAARGIGEHIAHSSTLAIAEPMTLPLLLDKEIREPRLEIRHRASGSLVAVIEVLSPSNKIAGSCGRASFLAKRQDILISEDVHWIEIDLLRAGLPSLPTKKFRRSDYRVLLSRASHRLSGEFWPISVRQALPVIAIPLRRPDPDVPLDLQAVLNATYEQGAYDLSIDYRHKPDPPLAGADAAWAGKLLRRRRD